MDPELRERLADARERERRQRAKTRAAVAEIEMRGDLKTDRRARRSANRREVLSPAFR